MKKLIAFLLVAALLSGCAGNSTDLMKQTDSTQTFTVSCPAFAPVTENIAATDFAVRLFQNSVQDGENTLISPLSVLSALTMVANGAEGNTLTQMEAVLGADRGELKAWLHGYTAALAQEDNAKLSLANGIWFNENNHFTPNEDFLQLNAESFDAGIYAAPFDASTVRDINSWVKENTDGMIDEVLQEIHEDAVMYLVNALAFDAEWASVYDESQVRDGTFTTEDGKAQSVELMYSEVSDYLETQNATGFIRYYKDRDFAFVALLPNEGVTTSELVGSLTGEMLVALLAAPQNTTVQTAIPKFESEITLEMGDILQNMGMTDAFDSVLADFSGLGTCDDGNIFISQVLHKTYISVAEQGTRAGAVTVVETANGTAMMEEEVKTVYLDRPFVYMLVDCEANLPFFMGTCMNVNN